MARDSFASAKIVLILGTTRPALLFFSGGLRKFQFLKFFREIVTEVLMEEFGNLGTATRQCLTIEHGGRSGLPSALGGVAGGGRMTRGRCKAWLKERTFGFDVRFTPRSQSRANDIFTSVLVSLLAESTCRNIIFIFSFGFFAASSSSGTCFRVRQNQFQVDQIQKCLS